MTLCLYDKHLKPLLSDRVQCDDGGRETVFLLSGHDQRIHLFKEVSLCVCVCVCLGLAEPLNNRWCKSTQHNIKSMFNVCLSAVIIITLLLHALELNGQYELNSGATWLNSFKDGSFLEYYISLFYILHSVEINVFILSLYYKIFI